MSDLEIESFFQQFKDCYNQVSANEKRSTIKFKLGNELAYIHFSNDNIKRQMSRSIAPLLEQETNQLPALQIFCFEGNLENYSFHFPWTEQDFEMQGVIKDFNTDRFQCIYQHGSGAIIIFDNQTKEGIYYIESHRHIPYWETSRPFRAIFHWWTKHTPYQLLHAGGIGFSSSSMIISGKSGSGKSSTCLSAILHPNLLIAGDDHIIVDTKNRILYSLYQCTKVEHSNLDRMSYLKELLDNEFKDEERSLLFVEEKMPGKLLKKSQLNFSIAPVVSMRTKTMIIESSPAASLKSIAPTTLFQLPLIREEAFAKCVSLVRETRNFQALLGTNPKEIADTLNDFLENKVN
jgi:hypothetical protein